VHEFDPGATIVTVKRYRIAGRVQGVGFRAFVQRHGREMGLSGWVRNLDDGTVEALVEASEEAHALFEGLLREGPSYSRVQMVLVVDEIEPEALAPGFSVRFDGG
jgi:acylphosphatase